MMPPPLPKEFGELKVVVQPAKSLRFRYKSESGKSIITGDGNKPWPAVKVEKYVGKARLFASLVTASIDENDKEPPKPHPHILDGSNTRYGCFSKEITVTPTQNVFQLENIQLVSTKINNMKEALEERESKGIDPYGTGFEHKNRTSHIDKNYVRICFQLCVYQPEVKGERTLHPVCTHPIRNSNKKGDLEIVRITPTSGPASGERRMILLMNGISKKEDLRDVEFSDRKTGWKGKGSYAPKHVHELSAIAMVYPKYEPTDFSEPFREVEVRLVTAQGKSDPVKFFYSRDNPSTKKKRERKVDLPRPGKTEREFVPATLDSSSAKKWSDVSSEKSSGTQSGQLSRQPLSSASAANVSAPVPFAQPSNDLVTEPEDSRSARSIPEAPLPAALEQVSLDNPNSTSRSLEVDAAAGVSSQVTNQQAPSYPLPARFGLAANETAAASQGATGVQMAQVTVVQQPIEIFHHHDVRSVNSSQPNFVPIQARPWGVAAKGTSQTLPIPQFVQPPATYQLYGNPNMVAPQHLVGPESTMTALSQPSMDDFNHQDESSMDLASFDENQAAMDLFKNINSQSSEIGMSLPFEQTPVQSTLPTAAPQQPTLLLSLPGDLNSSQRNRPKPAPRGRSSTQQNEQSTPPQPARRRSAPLANIQTPNMSYGHQHLLESGLTPSTASTVWSPEIDEHLNDLMEVIQSEEQESQT